MDPEQRIQTVLDYDKFQPYFIGHDENEEFYGTTVHTPSPSEDIWKKFELLPTPPRSPDRPPQKNCVSVVAEELQQVFETLDDDNLTQTFIFPDLSNLKSNLIQDCMWSGGNHGSQEETKSKQPSPAAVLTASVTPPPPMEYAAVECVDPTAVFPYPLNDPRDQLGLPSPSDSEEEIDVVTVAEKMQAPKRKVGTLTPVSSNTTANSNIALKRIRLSHSAASTPAKKSKPELTMSELKVLMQQSNSNRRTPGNRSNSRPNSRPSSDSEDNDKRATHNVLERKRRNDLKSSFLTLRDNVPELESQERAPKVVILRKATEHIKRVTADELILMEERDVQRKRNAILVNRLNKLKNGLKTSL